MTAAFELDEFSWADGAFEVAGRWTGTAPGRPRLVVTTGGRRRRINASPAAPVNEGTWHARFPCTKRPADMQGAELEIGSDLVVELPAPQFAAVAVAATDAPGTAVADDPAPAVRAVVEAAETVREELREAGEAAEALVARLVTEREALEATSERIGAERAEAERTLAELKRAAKETTPAAPPVAAAGRPAAGLPAPRIAPRTPRREEIRAALQRPREPTSVLPLDEPESAQKVAYALAGAILLALIVLLIILL